MTWESGHSFPFPNGSPDGHNARNGNASPDGWRTNMGLAEGERDADDGGTGDVCASEGKGELLAC